MQVSSHLVNHVAQLLTRILVAYVLFTCWPLTFKQPVSEPNLASYKDSCWYFSLLILWHSFPHHSAFAQCGMFSCCVSCLDWYLSEQRWSFTACLGRWHGAECWSWNAWTQYNCTDISNQMRSSTHDSAPTRACRHYQQPSCQNWWLLFLLFLLFCCRIIVAALYNDCRIQICIYCKGWHTLYTLLTLMCRLQAS